MNKEQIKEELRRSACDDKSPFFDCNWDAFCEVTKWRVGPYDVLPLASSEVIRTTFLLVAEAM